MPNNSSQKENQIKLHDLKLSDKSVPIKNSLNIFLKNKAVPKLFIFFEDYGKTIIFTIVVLVVATLLLNSVFKIKDKQKSEIIQSLTPTSLEINPSLDNDLTYAGFTASYKELEYKARIQTSSDSIDKIQIYNETTLIDVKTYTFYKPADNKGSDASLMEMVEANNPAEYLALKDKKFALSSPVINNQTKASNYKLIDSVAVNTPSGQMYPFQYPILAPLSKIEKQLSKAEISISIKTENLNQDQINQNLDSAKKIISSLDRVDKKEIFIDSSTKGDLDKLFNDNQSKFIQSELLKYKIYIPDGYTLKADDKINRIFITNDKSTLEIIKRDNQTDNLSIKTPNVIQVGNSKAFRPASISEIKENLYKLPVYGNEGKSRTVDVSKDNVSKNHNLLVNYIFKFNQSVDDLRKSISDFDIILSSISENKAPSGNCELLKGQSIPFKSPLCGKELDWTQINKGYSGEHKAIDLVPNQRYSKENSQYQRDKKEYFYATCDGKIRIYQDRESRANVIEIQCREPDFKVQYWHDQESFWAWNGEVKAGQIIGVMGETGNSENGKHIHYIVEKAGIRQDPLQLIKNN